MRPLPVMILQAGEPPRPLTRLQPIWVETQHTVNAIPIAKVVLSVAGDPLAELPASDADITQCQPGKPVALYIVEKGLERCIFRGVIMQQKLRLRRSGAELTLILRHDLRSLLHTHRSQVFVDQTDAQAVGQLLLAQGVPLLGATGMSTRHEQLVQFRCPDWHFLRRRLNATGTWLFPSPDGVKIAPPRLNLMPDHRLQQRAVVRHDDTLIEEGGWLFSEQYQPATVSVSSWNDRTQLSNTVLGEATSLGSQAFDVSHGRRLNHSVWAFNTSAPLGLEETADRANSLLMNLQAAGAQGEFTLDGSVAYQLGQTVALEGFGIGFDGQGIITDVRQRLDKNDGWRTTLSLGTHDAVRDMHFIPQAAGLHIGVIAAFAEDPTGMNRLRVRLPVLGDSEPPLWARLATPYASQMSGFCFYPEPGDEVVIGFFDEDPCYPVILGAMHNPVNRAPIAPSLENSHKALVINHNGVSLQLAFDTLAYSAQLSVGDNALTMSQEEGVQLGSKENLLVKAPRIAIEGDETTLLGELEVKITGKEIKLSQ